MASCALAPPRLDRLSERAKLALGASSLERPRETDLSLGTDYRLSGLFSFEQQTIKALRA